MKRWINKKKTESKVIDDVIKWVLNGCLMPPNHAVKQLAIKELQEKSNNEIFVESGTCYGEMVEAQKHRFKTIYSIELSEKLFKKSKLRFAKNKHINILHGDSGKVLVNVMSKVTKPAIFWLDGHYSGDETAKGDTECPIIQELNAILLDEKKLNHIIMIDDARCFNGIGDYPSIKELENLVKSHDHEYKMGVINDIIRFYK